MSILELEFHDNTRNWHLSRTEFGSSNLLVGNSGVGKTRVLRALQTIKGAAVGLLAPDLSPYGMAWTIRIRTSGAEFTWSVETTDGATRGSSSLHADSSNFVYKRELVHRDSDLLIERDLASFQFDGKSLPKLNSSQSAISLLQNEDEVSPLYGALSRITVGDQTPHAYVTDQTLNPVGDAEDDGYEATRRDLENYVHAGSQIVRKHVVVANCCVETWLLGNRKMLKAKPEGEDLRSYKSHFDVSKNDPEMMSKPDSHTASTADFHYRYLQEMLREKGLTHTKVSLGPVRREAYFRSLVERTKNTGHITSFQSLLTCFTAMGSTYTQ